MKALRQITSGEAGLGASIVFLFSGIAIVALLAPLLMYLIVGGSNRDVVLVLLFLPVSAGLTHAAASFISVWRAARRSAPSVRVGALILATLYALLVLIALCAALMLWIGSGL